MFEVTVDKKQGTMQNMLDRNKLRISTSEECNKCNKSIFYEKSITAASAYIILKINFKESAVDNNKKYPIRIVGIPKDCITIDDETYEFTAMVQHISQFIKSNVAYSAWFKKKNLTYTFQEISGKTFNC